MAPRSPFPKATLAKRPLRLARSPWPCTAGDQARRRRVALAGPVRGVVESRVTLTRGEPLVQAGLCVGEDGSLLVSHCGRLTCCTAAGVRWSRRLTTRRDLLESGSWATSAPLALSGGMTVLTVGGALLAVDRTGEVRLRLATRRHVSVCGSSPSLDHAGRIVLTTVIGRVLRFIRGRRDDLPGVFGYDTVAPAFFDDGSLAIAGYAWTGLVRVKADGVEVWRGGLDADLVPSINRAQDVASGSYNEGSAIFSQSGKRLGTYAHSAVFAELNRSDWIALSRDRVARRGRGCDVVWSRPVVAELRLGSLGPIVDARGRAYVPTTTGLACFARDGSEVFDLQLGRPTLALAPMGAGRLALVSGCEVVFVG